MNPVVGIGRAIMLLMNGSSPPSRVIIARDDTTILSVAIRSELTNAYIMPATPSMIIIKEYPNPVVGIASEIRFIDFKKGKMPASIIRILINTTIIFNIDTFFSTLSFHYTYDI